jgi:hypothetical protein
MSTREIQDITFKMGVFMFEGGSQNEGMIVPHYNIRDAKIEYFFIPSSRVEEYNKAKASYQHDAYRYYGNQVPEQSIKQARL